MKVLHIDSSVRSDRSVSKQLSKLFVDSLAQKNGEVTIDYLDLTQNTPKHVSALFIQGNYSNPEDRSLEMIDELADSEALVDRLHKADIYVIGMPMYNFSIPSNFKAFIDNVVRIGRTFKASENGFQGLLLNKKVYVINTRGVDFTNEAFAVMDQLQPYIKTVFGFMGLSDIQFINVHPVQFAAEEARIKAISKAEMEITAAVDQLFIQAQ
ncbi:FMN-dependent NADH-azoreductase [Mucilaginibacter pineti]|uniref:FMN dependent NADH:quinone oxidoreductase n=1 Tax=Mucilaginibacter pineti TaxID=1391627 RepID=A0A1G7NS10_9SPHI|nr:NAD(P)H-dependent oxidoreductase [Mucilaginibacter pineti]SDF76727.1 FMN-dependent NADH-azoreductase [Mucilaginibacter pineti]